MMRGPEQARTGQSGIVAALVRGSRTRRLFSAGRWLASENRQLSVESTHVGGPRFAAGDIGGEVRILVQHTRCFQPEQHRHHHQVARTECTIEPVGIAKATGKFAQPLTDAILDHGQALREPGLVALQELGGLEIKDRRLNRVERGKHPCDRARPGIRIVWQQACMALGDMEHDRPRLKQDKIAFFIGRNLPERMKRRMRRFLHRTERNKTNLVRLAHFFKRPANAHVTRQSLAAIGRPFKGGDGGGHWVTILTLYEPTTNGPLPIRHVPPLYPLMKASARDIRGSRRDPPTRQAESLDRWPRPKCRTRKPPELGVRPLRGSGRRSARLLRRSLRARTARGLPTTRRSARARTHLPRWDQRADWPGVLPVAQPPSRRGP